jgi:hypothetical protein
MMLVFYLDAQTPRKFHRFGLRPDPVLKLSVVHAVQNLLEPGARWDARFNEVITRDERFRLKSGRRPAEPVNLGRNDVGLSGFSDLEQPVGFREP